MQNPRFEKSASEPVADARAVSGGGRQVLDLLLKTGGLSQADITRRLDLSQPTVARLIQSFQRSGMVQLANRQVDRPGNPSVHVTLNPDFTYVLGVAMLGDMLSMALLDFSGRQRGYRVAAMPDMSRGPVLETLDRFRASLIGEAGVDAQRVRALGVGISGFFVGEGRQINPPAYLNDWALVEIEPILQEALGLPATLDNDATAAAIGESVFGVGRGSANFAYLHLTNGFGGGIIANGRALRGHNGNAGEFGGVWTLDGGGYPNLDLLRACVAEAGRPFDTVEDMVRAIDLDCPGVEAWLAQALGPFQKLAGFLSYMIDPEFIVIGGRLPQSIAVELAQRIVIPCATNRLGRPPPLPKVVVSQVRGDPVALGAAAMPLQAGSFL
ncbi:MAG: ROK family transcriptional regulator [Stenotrophomonas sp.]|nr:ROK family transcriptional regulator [Stenotrophomonas sp.]